MKSNQNKTANSLKAYLETNREFMEMLSERTDGEAAFDREVLSNLRRGIPIQDALSIAGERYPNEALQWTADTIGDIRAHYDYLKNHEDIMTKLGVHLR